MLSPHTVIFDGYNLLHRARSGFAAGDWAVMFNFFRSLRSEIEKHQPTRAIFTLEGVPRQFMIDESYKANRRVVETDQKKIDNNESFHRQKGYIIELLRKYFPLSVMRHPDTEADDLIYNLVKRSTRAVPFTVVSTDTDFIQLLDIENVKLYNPVRKTYIERVPYDYVVWKALRGDGTDNIKGLPGVSDKTATKLVNDATLLNKLLTNDELYQHFKRNLEMIRFKQFTEEETIDVVSHVGERNWDAVKQFFTDCKFQSIVNDKSWKKFTQTFDHLFGE